MILEAACAVIEYMHVQTYYTPNKACYEKNTANK